MEYAIVKSGGKQYKVTPGSVIDVDRLPADLESNIFLDKVLLHVANDSVSVGAPFLDSVKVKAKILEHLKGDKIRVAKFKAKARYRKVTGFRHYLTRLQIETIETSSSKSSKKEPSVAKKPESVTRRKVTKKK